MWSFYAEQQNALVGAALIALAQLHSARIDFGLLGMLGRQALACLIMRNADLSLIGSHQFKAWNTDNMSLLSGLPFSLISSKATPEFIVPNNSGPHCSHPILIAFPSDVDFQKGYRLVSLEGVEKWLARVHRHGATTPSSNLQWKLHFGQR